MDGGSAALRERTRRAVQAELTASAMALFVEQGFEATTVDQITAAAGLSRRSFFRYFATKEEVLLHTFEATGDQLAAALAARPPAEAPWTALRRCFDALLGRLAADPDRSLVLLGMMLGSPALTGAHLAKQGGWSRAITEQLTARHPGGASPAHGHGQGHERAGRERAEGGLAAAALAAAALACLEVAQAGWVESEGRRALDDLLDEAMAAVHPL